jgi:hypothetical protein
MLDIPARAKTCGDAILPGDAKEPSEVAQSSSRVPASLPCERVLSRHAWYTFIFVLMVSME